MAQQGLIFQVPNEILLKIFNEIVLPEAPYQLTWPLALTCKRFYTLAQPIVWSHVTFQNDDWDQDPLWKQPGHKARVRSQRTRECLKIAPHCVSFAKRVSLLGRGEIGFKNAIDVVQEFPNLKRLDIESVRNISRIWDESSRRGDRYVVEDPKIAAPPPGLEGSAGFDELHVSRFKFGSPDALRNFLLWPKSLKVFSIDELASGGFTWDYLLRWENCCKWNYQMLVDILIRHATTLRVLRIRQMGTESFDEVNINHFTALDTLEICSSSLLPTPRAACESWALANLKRLVMNCSASSSRHGPQSYFIERIQEWLKQFANAVVHRKKSCQVALQEIEILWYTDSFHHSMPLPDERRRMEDVRLHIQKCGLQAILTFQDRYPPIEDDEGYEDEF